MCNLFNATGMMTKCSTECCEGDLCNGVGGAVRMSGLVASFAAILLALNLNLFPGVYWSVCVFHIFIMCLSHASEFFLFEFKYLATLLKSQKSYSRFSFLTNYACTQTTEIVLNIITDFWTFISILVTRRTKSIASASSWFLKIYF